MCVRVCVCVMFVLFVLFVFVLFVMFVHTRREIQLN